MLDKLKKFGTDVKDKTGRGVEYAKGKTQGFKHPEAVEQHVQVLRWNRDQIPKFYSRISSLDEHSKEMASSEKKLAEEFAVLGGHENEHPELAQYIRAVADAFQQIAEDHFVFQTKVDEIRVDWKQFETKDLNEIEKIYDKTNHALTDARYWRSHSNPGKLADSESKYKQYSSELVDQINRLREKKETLFPEYIKRLAEAQVCYYRSALSAAERLQSQIDTVGPITPAPMVPLDSNFDIGDLGVGAEKGDKSSGSSGAVGAGVQAPSRPQPQPVAPVGQKRAKALYDFAAQGPDELSFAANDVLVIINTAGDWWTAELNGRRGLIPGNYVQMI